MPTDITQDTSLWLAGRPEVADGCVYVRLVHSQYYLPNAPQVTLLALLAVENHKLVAAAMFEEGAHAVSALPENAAQLRSWCAARALACVDLVRPLALKPVHIAKPWGQEIWYTGIEARGQSAVQDERGHALPLPWLLALLPDYLAAGAARSITLLKILDPLPEPVFGDLYFEMHEQKQEVYVVTQVHPHAWPQGQGGIRLGFCQRKRGQYANDDAFKAAYLGAVYAYQRVRNSIDSALDDMRRREGIDLNAPVAADQLKAWLRDVPETLAREERQLRAELDSFAAVRPLKVGDVVKVPCLTPHSLLHGVTTIEFQTPVYERKILSFAQKVLTQDHWDTAAAMADISLAAPPEAPLPLLSDSAGCRREQVVAFDDFAVERVRLAPGAQLSLELAGRYGLVMAIQGQMWLCDQALPAMQARLVAAGAGATSLENPGAGDAVALISVPR